jgi:hypothetical protein
LQSLLQLSDERKRMAPRGLKVIAGNRMMVLQVRNLPFFWVAQRVPVGEIVAVRTEATYPLIPCQRVRYRNWQFAFVA